METEKEANNPSASVFCEQFRTLLESGAHSDITFIVGVQGEEKVEIRAHRAVLSARSHYFQAMLNEDSRMSESLEGIIRTQHDPTSFRRMLEFIYSNTVRGLDTAPPSEVIDLLMLANEHMLDDLQKLCEKTATKIISIENIGRLLLISSGHNASALRSACYDFVRDNKQQLAQDPGFRQDIEHNPELGLLLFESSLPKQTGVVDADENSPGWASASSAPGGTETNKRRRVADPSSENEQDAFALPQPYPSVYFNTTTSTAGAAGMPTGSAAASSSLLFGSSAFSSTSTTTAAAAATTTTTATAAPTRTTSTRSSVGGAGNSSA